MTVLIVDAANVVGSVPDGWWRDRRGATERLRDRLAGRGETQEVLLVVEGAARGVGSVSGVRVVPASGSGDDKIVELAAEHAKGGCRVATSDRALRARLTAPGVTCVSPRTVDPR
ncbi:NTP pyrophosphohydrolase [Streptomyces sp. NPDC006879]|uniref:NTP pyrophosphohydrolase n=1 Tax=Streptomyces sp. NPDC006879 TaxID=3364767 RepID=UPI0036B2B6A2